MAVAERTLSIVREPSDWLPLVLPGAEGVSIKVYKVDEPRRIVLLKARFEPGSRMPRHQRHCRAIAYTISGAWAYDEGAFESGDLAYELFGTDYLRRSKSGAELFITLISDTDQFIDSELPDGRILHLGLMWFKALQGISLGQYEKLDRMALMQIHPARRIAPAPLAT